MTTLKLSRRMFVSPGAILLATLIAVSLALVMLPRSAPTAFAATLRKAAEMTEMTEVAGTACAQSPTAEHCDNQDPQLQGCAADAQTLQQADIKEHGSTIGKIELRWSLTCHSWWGRVFDMRPGLQANMSIRIAGTALSAAPTFVGDHYRILYSSMVFDASATQASPAIMGSLSDNTGRSAGATLPAMSVPEHHHQQKGA